MKVSLCTVGSARVDTGCCIPKPPGSDGDLEFNRGFLFVIHPPPNLSNGQVDPSIPRLLRQRGDLFHAVDNHSYDIPVIAKSTPFISAGRILVEVPDVV